MNRLRRSCRHLWVAALGLLFGGAVLLAPLWGWPAAARWAAQAGAVWVWVLIRLETLLDLNRHPTDNRLRPSLGAANGLTLGRAALVAALAGFLFQDPLAHASSFAWLNWVPGTLYLAAALMDGMDGWAARTTGGETQLGEALDTQIDAMGILVACLLLVSTGKAPLAFISVGLGYYAVSLASRLRSWIGRTAGRVQPRADARMVAGCLMGFAAAALLPVFDPNATVPAASVMAGAFLWGLATDWLIICGWAAPDGRLYQRRLAAWQAAGARLLPLFLRATVVIGIVGFIYEPCFAKGIASLSGILLFGLLCSLGVATRLAAVIGSLIMAALISAGCRSAGATIALAAAVALIMTGAGHPRIWQPEDMFFLKKRI